MLNYLHLSINKKDASFNNQEKILYNDILELFKEGDLSFSKVHDMTGIPTGILNTLLTKLELNGILSRSISGNWYRL